MPMRALPLVAPTNVGPQPCPTEYGLGSVRTPDGQDLAIVQFSTVVGVHMYFFTPDALKRFGEACLAQAARVDSGLIVPVS